MKHGVLAYCSRLLESAMVPQLSTSHSGLLHILECTNKCWL